MSRSSFKAPSSPREPVLTRSTSEFPDVDWTRYHLQVLIIDRTDTLRARVAAGLFEKAAEW